MTSKQRRPERAATDAERTLWQLSRDEQRVLIITFAGGLASILVGAVVLGGAVALAHYEETGNSLSSLAFGTGLAVALTALCTAVVLIMARLRRRGRRGEQLIATVLGVMYLILLMPLALLLCLIILTWIGIAAGIH